MDKDIVEIGSYASTFDADVVIAHLASEGIEAFLVADDAGGVIPSMTTLGGGARVLVRAADAQAASAAIRALEDADDVESD